MERPIGCLIWILFAIIWLIVGFLSYHHHEPDTFFSVLFWLCAWQVYAFCLATVTILLREIFAVIVVAIQNSKDKK